MQAGGSSAKAILHLDELAKSQALKPELVVRLALAYSDAKHQRAPDKDFKAHTYYKAR